MVKLKKLINRKQIGKIKNNDNWTRTHSDRTSLKWWVHFFKSNHTSPLNRLGCTYLDDLVEQFGLRRGLIWFWLKRLNIRFFCDHGRNLWSRSPPRPPRKFCLAARPRWYAAEKRESYSSSFSCTGFGLPRSSVRRNPAGPRVCLGKSRWSDGVSGELEIRENLICDSWVTAEQRFR